MSNRQWLKELAASETKNWMTSEGPLGLEGLHRLETRHTIYIFDDGVCVDVARRDCERSVAQESAIGMRVVGWLLDIEGRRRLLSRWLPGARAVMWRAPSDAHCSKIAMTSPSFGFVTCSQPDPDDDEDDLAITAEYVPPPSYAGSSGSFTRLFTH
jgi:hypothetical protein